MDFERELERHKDAVYRQMLRVCGNVEDAEDVLVEAIVKGLRRADTLDDPTAFRSWLTTIGKRVCYRLQSQRKSEHTTSLEALQAAGVPMPAGNLATGEDVLEMDQMHDCVMHAFDALPASFKDVYWMREIEGRSSEETAKKLGLSVANVKTRLHRARVLIRRALDATVGLVNP
jgi:RNA polymerase sigma-70 factor (ECF subfamily)